MPAHPSDAPEEPEAGPVRVVFRLPRIALLVVFAAEMCAIPAAFALPGLQVILLVPLLAGVWVVRNRTTADPEKLVLRRTLSSETLPWSEVVSLRLRERSWVRAVRADDREVVLPAVRLRHLPMLATVSGGRLPDPSREQQPAQETEQEPERDG